MFSQVAILGIFVDNVSMHETVSTIDDWIQKGGYHQVATANVDFISKAACDPGLMHILHGCDLVLADGMPLVWASRMMGTPLKERVTGADLLPRLLELSASKQRRIFLLGAMEAHSRCAFERIRREYPDAQICGRFSPPVAPLEEMVNADILRHIEESKPDILLVAFGNPKQEKWLAMHRHTLNVPVCIGVGASIDFFSGKQLRAPMWMRQVGLEWLFRLGSEPRRLGFRYLDNALFLLRHLSGQLLLTSVQARNLSTNSISFTRVDGSLIAKIGGAFTGSIVTELRTQFESEWVRGCSSFILDLSTTTTIWPDAIGLIASQKRSLLGTESQIVLVGLQAGVRKVLRSTFPAGDFLHTAATIQEALLMNERESVAA